MEFKDSETRICLARAFAGLCQDGARYQLIKKSAQNDDLGGIAKFFETIAEHKMAHATVLYKLMTENMNRKKDNVPIEAGYPFESFKLQTGISGSAEIEEYEGKNLFTHFAKIAHDEGFSQIEKLFTLISEVCLNFSSKLKTISIKFEGKQLYKSKKQVVWQCSNCGHEEKGTRAWNNCPLCSYPQGYVQLNIQED